MPYPEGCPARMQRTPALRWPNLRPPPEPLEILTRSTPFVRQGRNRKFATEAIIREIVRICAPMLALGQRKHHRHLVSGLDSA